MDERARTLAPDLAQQEQDGRDYNPLEYVEGIDEEEWEDDDRLILPDPLAQPPEPKHNRVSVYSPQYAGSVENAVGELVRTNAGRRRILLSIVDWARDGIAADELFEKIAEAQADNLSVYEPVSYCRMLERAGALTFEDAGTDAEGRGGTEGAIGAERGSSAAGASEVEGAGAAAESERPAGTEGAAGELAAGMPAGAGAAEAGQPVVAPDDDLAGLSFMGIDEEVQPVWRATPEGLAAYEGLTRGDEWRERVLGQDAIYAEVYLAVMQMLHEGGKTKAQVCDVAEAFEVTHEPRRWGAYFIDVLEATDAIQWKGQLWVLTELGEALLDELAQYCAQAA